MVVDTTELRTDAEWEHSKLHWFWPQRYPGHLHEATPQFTSGLKSTIIPADQQKWPLFSGHPDTAKCLSPQLWREQSWRAMVSEWVDEGMTEHAWVTVACWHGQPFQDTEISQETFYRTTEIARRGTLGNNPGRMRYRHYRLQGAAGSRGPLCLLPRVFRICHFLSISKAQMLKRKRPGYWMLRVAGEADLKMAMAVRRSQLQGEELKLIQFTTQCWTW